ncbi:zinc finger protein 469 [Anguilla anguilla]|uniref:zinc finger protein 469 n=1 Tax=Anguilla anguilla TaxID=7936 RepID=UPI0015A99CCD|nr:zinc finger protein 469 [Anguilla anguilla]XP_035275331.1 zinc finger protein 469 [Anguilla anguilla]
MGSTAKETPARRAHTMTGETQHARAVKESDNVSKQQEAGALPERFGAELKQESAGQYKTGCPEPRALSRTKECTQREAVIRPQQAGKIDFKSLQNRPKFTSDRTWHSSKGSPQSPSGKSRTRDKSKRSGKAERGNPQQLYRLSISNPRANPTIGIAYPQQKFTPPKKLEAGRGPISGSYRFHVPSIPEREAELQQEELSYNRCFQEASSNITSTNYTSQADSSAGGTPAHQHPPPPQQQPSLRDNNNSQPGSQLLFPEFPVNRAVSWQSPDKSFSGANYGASSQKLPIFSEGDKVNATLVPLQFQYGYPSLQDAEVDPFPCDQNNRPQDYLDIALATAQVTHSSFTFHTSGEGQEDTQTDSQFSNKQPEGRSSYAQLSQHAQYLQSQHETQSSLHCHKGRSKHHTNSENSVPGLHKIDQGKDTVPENPGSFNQVDGEGATPISVEKQSCPPSIESTASQRILTQGNPHHARNIAQGQSPQILSPSKAYSSSSGNTMHVGSVPLEESIPGGSSKTHSRLLETWDGANKTFSSMDQNSALYSNLNNKCQFQCQPTSEQRQPSSNSRMAWQQIQLTSAIPKQNRIQLSRQLSNQKPTFPIGAMDWQESKKTHKNRPLNSFHNKIPNEAFTSRRPESIKEHNNTISTFPFEHRVDSVSSTVCDTRNKPVYFGVNQSLPYSKTNSHGPSQGPPVGLMTTASYDSPLPSPLQNPASTSPCSSVSPASHSPVDISPEDSQVLMAGPPPPLYHQNQEKTLMPLDHLNSNLHHFHTDLSRTFSNPPERPKEDMLSYMHNNKCSNPNMDGGKSYLNSYEVEHPPPPYSAHQLLATSLAAANLDQLDVLLTCKQCDQNFNNLVSFLDHKQYCGQHMLNQNNMSKIVPKMEEHRKYQTDCTKASSSGMGFPLSRCPSDPHLSLLGLSKNGELMPDSETKGDIKDEPLKLNFFSGTNTLPVTLPELDMDDAKLDSLITEALNGLGYQSDNAEIDSSFIDAFVDDDLTTSLNMKTKDYVMVNSRSKHETTTDQRSQTQGKNLFDSDRDSMSAETKHTLNFPEKTHQDFKQEDKVNSKEVTPHKKSRSVSSEKSTEEKEWTKEGIKTTDKTGEKNKIDSRFLLSRKFSERCKLKSFQERSSLIMPSLSHSSSANWSLAAPRATVKEGKRRKAGGGTWSKELIHKIVQQKNKPHKLNVKGTKNLQFSLVTERLTPAAQSPKFGEYDYVSDSDEESEPLRLASRGRLGHAGRCKYTYSKEYKGKYTYSKEKGRDWTDKGGSVLWKHLSKDSGVEKVAEQISPSPAKESSNQRMRRRSSRSSSSSELSEPASVSSESITSPKTADRTDSESERALAMRRMSSNNMPLSDSFEPDNCKKSLHDTSKEPTTPPTPTTPTALSSHPFSKNTKKYGSAKFLLSHDKGPLPRSRILSLRDRGSENTAELSKTSGFQSHGEDHSTEQEREKEHSAEISMTERAEEPSPIKKSDRMGNSSFTGTPVTFQTTGGHCKFMVADVKSPDSKNSIKNEKCGISTQDKSVYKRNEHGKLSNYSVALQQSSEIPAIPAFETIGDNVYTSKEEIHIDCDILPNSSHQCTAHVEEACLCPLDMQRPAIQAKEDLVSYTIEPDQSLIKSPLSFDTSSMFGDLTVGGFENSLYTDVSKDSFNSFITRNDKRELFESSSPHLGLKDWDLIADVPPMLPEEISHFKDLSEKAMTKKPNSNHIHLPLPDKMMEDNSSFISGLSEDELEIKRIVTELETQLQIAKLNSPLLLPNNHPKQLIKSNLSPLPLDNTGNEQSNMHVGDNEEARGLSAPNPTQDLNLSLWSSPSHLGLLEAQQDLHTPVHDDHSSLEHPSTKEDPIPTESQATKELQLQEMKGTDEIKNLAADCLKSEEILENEMYTENLMKSLEVISDSIFNKGSLTAEIQTSNSSQFLKQDQPCKECPDARKQQSKNQGSPSADEESQKPEEHNALVFPGENAECSAKTRSDLSPKTSESETKITTCEPESKMCVPVNENVIGVNKSLNKNDKDLLLDKSHIIEEKIQNDESLLPETTENCHMTEEDGDVLRDKEHPLQPPELFLSSTVQSNDKELVMASYPTILSADQSSIVSDKSKEDDPPLLSLEEFHPAEENFKEPSNSDLSEKSAVCEVPNKGRAEDFKKKKSPACWDLLQSCETEEVQSTAINEEAHQATLFKCSTPDNAASDSVAKVSHERTINSSNIVDQESTAETLYQVNLERTTEIPGQVNQETKTDMPCQIDQERTTNIPCQVDQDRTMDVVSQINHEGTTSMLCKDNQERTLDTILQTNEVDQERTPDVHCSLLSTEAEAKSNEKSDLMLGEHASTLEKEPLVLTSLEEETVAGPKCTPTPTQVLSALTMLPLHAMRLNNAVRAEENITGAIPQSGLSPLSSSLPYSEDHSQVEQDQSEPMWVKFNELSPDSMHHRQSPKRDEQNSSEMQLCDPPVSIMSEMPNVMTALPHIDIVINENKSCGPDSDSIISDTPLISTLEPSNSLLKSRKMIEKGLSESLPALKQNPLIYTEISASPHSPPVYSDITQTLNKNLEEQGIFKRSPKDNHDHCELISVASISAVSSVDRSSLEVSSGPETAMCLYSHDTSSQSESGAKLSCPVVACSQYKDSSVPSIFGLDHKIPQDVPNLDICHPPLETIDYMDLHVDLLKKAEAEKLGLQSSPSEQNAPSCQQDASGTQENLHPLVRCAEEASGIPSCQTEPLKAEEGQCASNKTDTKGNFNDSRQKSMVQKKNTMQGEILCEICFACFRTVPGLKRHKAMKHFMKKNGNAAIENLQGSVSIFKDDTALLDPQVYLHTDCPTSLPYETNVPSFMVNQKEPELNVILGGTGASETTKTMVPRAKENKRTLQPVTKTKKGCKAQKSRDTGDQNGCFEFKKGRSSPFSDELLSILKTDILQAITPDFPATPHEPSCLPEKQDKINTTECLEVRVPESFSFKLIDSAGKKDVITGHTEQNNAHKQGLAVDPVEAEMEEGKGLEPKMFGCDRTTGNTICSKFEESGEDCDDLKETCEQKDICFEDSICRETLAEVAFEVKCEKATCITDRVDPKPCSFKAASAFSPGPDPDLEALLDDERTFSQLFPRDEEMVRKKCKKVYGKKNKKQNSDSNLLLGKSCPVDSISSDKKEQHAESHDDEIPITKIRDHCEYETISIDDAIMLDMCHKSTVKNDCEKISPTPDQHEDDVDSGKLGAGHFLCLTEDPICKTATEWSSPRHLTDSVAEKDQSSETPILCKTEEPTMSCPPLLSNTSSLHSSESPAQENASHFHGIDIQNLNTKFQLPEIQFLEASEEVPVILPIGSDDMTISQSTRPNKRPAERRGRRRVERGSKPKDKQYKCKVCFTWFLTLGELNFHKLSHNPSPPPTCYMCVQRKFSSREQLRDHLREKHAKNKAGIWTCGMCLKEISDVWMYNEHLREHATQFARKGQTQSSILGLPGCFMQETAVKNFITSIMQHQSNKGSRGESGKMSSKEGAKTTKENMEQDSKTSEGGETTAIKTKVHSGGGGKRSTPILSDIPHKADAPQKNVEMHPNCKDPSRDCHHCGKQFPKPFKLQRHLVVHSLQKIFLCSKCPISYQDAKELKDHLKNEHEEIEEPDSKHTTLYTCELCADVMHVIKKSFICSTCNYTFSKKEQFDRHMEKHLSGGNKIFKFRGVVRPSKPSASTNDGEFDLPPVKRRKLLSDSLLGNSSENSTANMASGQFDQSSELLLPRPMSAATSDFTETSNTPSSGSKDTGIKTEDIAGDVSEIPSELEHSQLQVVSEPLCLGEHCPTSEPTADAQTSKACEGDEIPLSEICDIKEENHVHSDLCQKPCNVLSSVLKECQDTEDEAGSSVTALSPLPEDIAFPNTVKAKVQEVDLSDSALSIEVSHVHQNENLMKISDASDMLEEDSRACDYKDAQRKSPENAVELTGGDEHTGEVQGNETEEKEPKVMNYAEQHVDGQGKEEVVSKLSDNTNCGPDDSPRPVARGLGVTPSAKNSIKPTAIISGRSEEKDLVRQQKKRKEMKVTQSSKVSSSATRENQDVDARNRKRLRVQSPSKCIWTGGYRKADAANDYPVLSSVRDDMTSNKILSKHKAGGLNLQPKRNSIDSNPPKKVEATRHAIGAYKGRKGVPGRPLHPPVSKTSVPIVNNSFNKYRPLSGRPVESHSYRTAESQNNLLTQLFGQKLTSFKIPLRKDTSEALN